MFLTMIVSIGCAVDILHLFKPTGSTNTLWPQSWPRSARKKYNNKEKRFKIKLNIYTTVGDVALTNISRETKLFPSS